MVAIILLLPAACDEVNADASSFSFCHPLMHIQLMGNSYSTVNQKTLLEEELVRVEVLIMFEQNNVEEYCADKDILLTKYKQAGLEAFQEQVEEAWNNKIAQVQARISGLGEDAVGVFFSPATHFHNGSTPDLVTSNILRVQFLPMQRTVLWSCGI